MTIWNVNYRAMTVIGLNSELPTSKQYTIVSKQLLKWKFPWVEEFWILSRPRINTVDPGNRELGFSRILLIVNA